MQIETDPRVWNGEYGKLVPNLPRFSLLKEALDPVQVKPFGA